MDGAGAALGDAASVLGAGQAELVTENPEQGDVVVDADHPLRTVDPDRRHSSEPIRGRNTPGCG
jgi:hypothetical protein